MISCPIIPLIASLFDSIRNVQVRKLFFPLQKVDEQAARSMPGDMAMERPSSWIVTINLEDKILVGAGIGGQSARHNEGIASGWVFGILDNTIPFAGSLGKNVHVMAVEMHRMRCGCSIIDNHPKTLCLAGVKNIRVDIELIATVTGGKKKRVVKVSTESRVIHQPESVIGGVSTDCDVDGEGLFRDRSWCNREEWSGSVNTLINALSYIIFPGSRSWHN